MTNATAPADRPAGPATADTRPRPYARPRPDVSPAPAPAATDGDSALCNADSAPVTPAPATSADRLRTLHSALKSAITDRARWAGWWGYAADLLAPPAVLAEQAPAVDQIRRYARYAGWTRSERGPVRALGIAWCGLVAIPLTVTFRVGEWVWQRPARALVVVLTVKALSFLPPVGWTVDRLLIPAVNAALRLFL